MEKPSKKKKTFLGFLMKLYIFFVFLIGVSVGLFFWQKKAVTVWFMNLYSKELANVMTSEKYYDIENDEQYKRYYEGIKGEASFDAKKKAQDILKVHHQDIATNLGLFVKSYEQNSEKDWLPILKEIKGDIKEIFADNKVSPEEYQTFLSKIKGYSK